MSIMDRYECDGQMGLFDFMEDAGETSFCWDDDINEIVGQLKELAGAYGLETGEAEFRIWDHVPHLGYRLWFDVIGTRAELFGNEAFRLDIEKLVDFAESRNIELTPMWGGCMFFGKDEKEKGRLHFTTMFMDKERQRRK